LEKYQYPIAYIDIDLAKMLRSLGYLDNLDVIVNYNSKLYIDLEKKIFCDKPLTEGSRVFVEIVYEMLPEIAIDFENNIFRTDVAIYIPSKDTVLFIKKGSSVEILEAQGKIVIPLIDSGETVSSSTKVFYKITRKYEIRTSKAETTGVVVYVGEMFTGEVDRMIAVIVGEKDVIKLSRCNY